jgi:hypothetical protein
MLGHSSIHWTFSSVYSRYLCIRQEINIMSTDQKVMRSTYFQPHQAFYTFLTLNSKAKMKTSGNEALPFKQFCMWTSSIFQIFYSRLLDLC